MKNFKYWNTIKLKRNNNILKYKQSLWLKINKNKFLYLKFKYDFLKNKILNSVEDLDIHI